MANLFDVKGGKMLAILNKMAERMAPELGDEVLRDPALVDIMLKAGREYIEKNPFEMFAEDQLAALRRANHEERWGITEEDFKRLAATPPAWPKGRSAYRSFRLRFGEGEEGVIKTYKAHVTRLESVLGMRGSSSWEPVLSHPANSRPRLRLRAGNETHRPVVEWILADLGASRYQHDVQGTKMLADELLVIAWLFPKMMSDVGYMTVSALFAGGYEANVPSPVYEWETTICVGRAGKDQWQPAISVSFDRRDNKVKVGTEYVAHHLEHVAPILLK